MAVVTTTKRCYSCEEHLGVEEFYKNRARKDGFADECKTCTRKKRDPNYNRSEKALNAQLQYKYGIGVEDYKTLLEQQEGLCAICRKANHSFLREGRKIRLSVDHNHETGEIRGLLCARCNTAVGVFDGDIEMIERLAAYLSPRSRVQ
jgi:hypothetical protein